MVDTEPFYGKFSGMGFLLHYSALMPATLFFELSVQAAAESIKEHWECDPLYIREGGTMRVTPFLEAAIGTYNS